MRDYDPTTGRYTQADPLGLVDGASVYGYALQNPGRYVDPRGERTIAGHGGGGLAGLGVGIGIMGGIQGLGVGSLGGSGGGPLLTLPGDTPTTGEDAQSEAITETGVYCGDPCGDAREDLARAKERVRSLGRCTGNMNLNELTDRNNAFRRLMFTRANRDNICDGGSDAGHTKAITDVRNASRRCQGFLNAL